MLALKFLCFDKKGHTAVDIILIEQSWSEREEDSGKTSFELLFDPAALDQFVQEIFDLAESKARRATLVGNGDNQQWLYLDY